MMAIIYQEHLAKHAPHHVKNAPAQVPELYNVAHVKINIMSVMVHVWHVHLISTHMDSLHAITALHYAQPALVIAFAKLVYPMLINITINALRNAQMEP